MGPFWRWLAAAFLSFGTLAGGYHLHLDENPRRIAVIIDCSYPMRQAWSRAMEVVDGIESRRYAEFSLYTEKIKVHGWQQTLDANLLSTYAPRDLATLRMRRQSSEFDGVTEVVLITNAAASDLSDFDGWTILPIR